MDQASRKNPYPPINETIQVIYSCLPDDRNKFNILMDQLKKQFLFPKKNPSNFNQINNNIPYQNLNNQQNIFSPSQNQFLINNMNPINQYNFQNNDNKSPQMRQDNNFNDYNKPQQQKVIPNFKPINLQSIENNNNYGKNQENYYNNRCNNFVRNNYKNTLPERELLTRKPLRTNSLPKKYNDTHANVKFYYPEDYTSLYEGNNDTDHLEWHNQANNIMLNTNNNFYPSHREQI